MEPLRFKPSWGGEVVWDREMMMRALGPAPALLVSAIVRRIESQESDLARLRAELGAARARVAELEAEQDKAREELRKAADNIAHLRSVIDKGAQAWLKLDTGEPYYGDLGDAMVVAVQVITMLRHDRDRLQELLNQKIGGQHGQ